jgi:hypothetical protein
MPAAHTGRGKRMWTVETEGTRWLLSVPERATAHVELHLALAFLEVQFGVPCANQMHPYHLQPVQRLHPGDCNCRLQLCRWIPHKVAERPDVCIEYCLRTRQGSLEVAQRISTVCMNGHWRISMLRFNRHFNADLVLVFGPVLLMSA